MTKHLKSISGKREWIAEIPLVLFAALFLMLATAQPAMAQDSDGDGLSDATEAALGTDFLTADTDRDQFPDGVDSNPLSRAYIQWGNPFFTTNDDYIYCAPQWYLSAFKAGGEWITNGTWTTNRIAITNYLEWDTNSWWHVFASETNETALNVGVDRNVLTNNLRMQVSFFDHTGAVLYIDFYDTNGTVVATNLVGNILAESNIVRKTCLNLPLAQYSDAVGICLRRNAGEITIYETLLYIDEDGDGLDAEQEEQLGTSDSSADSDGDGLSDYAEVFAHSTDPAKWDSDGDSLSDGAEIAVYGTDPNKKDTDGDGINDGLEVMFGYNPAVSNSFKNLPFTENFETNTVTAGDINGQNGWTAVPAGSALVKSGATYEGSQSLEIYNASGISTVRNCFADSGAGVVWLDFYIKAIARPAPTGAIEGSYALYFGADMRPVVYDGHASCWISLSNMPPLVAAAWTRLTIKLDYAAQEWLFCVNGSQVTQNIGFASTVTGFNAFQIETMKASLDKLSITTTVPPDLSLDGDSLPDAWELAHFGNLYQSDSGDPDNDGLTNLQEYQFGTDPSLADSDGDGIDDALENLLGWGCNPAVSNNFSVLPFTENFETNTVNVGLLNGQNNWICSPAAAAIVQTGVVYEGTQALKMDSATGIATVRQFFASSSGTVMWVDLYVKATRRAVEPSVPANGSFALYFNNEGKLVVYDGYLQRWNVLDSIPPLAASTWARISVRLDYTAQEWLVCLNNALAADRLGFVSQTAKFAGFEIAALIANVDKINAGTNTPTSADSDGDGLLDFDEIMVYHTDPNISDSDGDGVSDGQEITNGTNPLAADQGSTGGPVVTVESPAENEMILW